MRKVLLLLLFFSFTLWGNAQQNGAIDAPGDIVFLGVSTSSPGFTFFLMDDAPMGTCIYFTDSDWDGSSFGMNPPYVKWEATSAQSRSTVISITNADNGSISTTIGSVTRSGNFTVKNNKFIIYATTDAPSTPGTFLAAISEEDPPELLNTMLTLGTHAATINMTGGQVLIAYTGPFTCTGSFIECLQQFNDPANWSDGTVTGVTFPPTIPPGGVVLPVELIQFTGQAQEDMVKIEWATATEINNDYFQLERSKDGLDFRVIGRIKGKGTSIELNRYSYNDENPLEGLNYYRLAQYDLDGSMEYSNVIVITMGQVSTGISEFYPNPTQEKLTQVNYYSSEDTRLVVRIQDLSGRVIETHRKDLVKGNNTLSFNLKERNTGVYIVTFEDANGLKQTKRLIIK